ncbi:MAG: ABC transporter substrate-binding protein [Solirubrobacterales bacterium]|nr:ABC transporter substrate-binding protein [Solirubrobacterales bacterium]
MRKISLIALSLALAVLVTACGTKSEQESGPPDRETFSVALDWYPNPDHAGFLVAEEKGYFKDAGLDVSLSSPSDPALPIKLVAAGKADVAISYEPEVLLARQQGLDVVAVASLVDQPLTSMIWLKKSKIKRVRDLKGKTVSTAGIAYQDAYLRTILKRAGLAPGQVKQVSVGQALLPSILSGRAKATLGPLWNIEGVQLKLEGRKPVINPVDRLGVPTYSELVLVAKGSRLESDPDPVRLFIAALARGTAAAVAEPEAATRAVLNANTALDPKVTEAQVRTTLPLLRRGGLKGTDQPFGYMDTAKWQYFISWMVEQKVLESSQMAVDALTNDYLPSSPIDAG